MKLFIGWSGTRSQALAQALQQWMPLVLHYVEPWLSEADVAAGERWAQAVAKELETSNFGIICVTRENVGSPWILFEAGSLAKSMQGSRVIPLLLDLEFSDISGPLAQFQAKKADKDGVSEVILSVNQAAAQPVPEPRARQLFDALWPQLEKQLASVPKQTGSSKPMRPQHEILEELVSGVRSLDSRLKNVEETVSSEPGRAGRFRRLRFHPMMFRELSHMIGEGPGDPITILLVASMVREEIPWCYELGIEAYRAARTGTPDEARTALRRFHRATELMMRGPFPLEELGFDPRALEMMARELQHLLPDEGSTEDEPRAKARRRREGKEE